MFGEFIAVLTTICWSIGIFTFTEASKGIGKAALNQYRLFLGWLVISILIICFYPISFRGLFSIPQFNQIYF